MSKARERLKRDTSNSSCSSDSENILSSEEDEDIPTSLNISNRGYVVVIKICEWEIIIHKNSYSKMYVIDVLFCRSTSGLQRQGNVQHKFSRRVTKRLKDRMTRTKKHPKKSVPAQNDNRIKSTPPAIMVQGPSINDLNELR